MQAMVSAAVDRQRLGAQRVEPVLHLIPQGRLLEAFLQRIKFLAVLHPKTTRRKGDVM